MLKRAVDYIRERYGKREREPYDNGGKITIGTVLIREAIDMDMLAREIDFRRRRGEF
jgi:hypothetical protein